MGILPIGSKAVACHNGAKSIQEILQIQDPFFPGNFPGNGIWTGNFPFPGKLKSPGNCKLYLGGLILGLKSSFS